MDTSPTRRKRTSSARSQARIHGANNRIRLGLIGLGARGYSLFSLCRQMPDVDVVAVCDPFEPFVLHAVHTFGSPVEGYPDPRILLERPDVDGVVVATPDHWHGLIGVMACQAGKDVYCEAPLAHTIAEGKRMVQAANRYRRVTQTGTQQRSADHMHQARSVIESGRIGKVEFVECWSVSNAQRLAERHTGSQPPRGLDWNLYLGPAPVVEYHRSRFIHNHRWYWDYSGGMMTDRGVHHLDSIHHVMGVDAPVSVSSVGGRYLLNDQRETPDFFRATFEYPGFVVSYTNNSFEEQPVEGRKEGVLFYGDSGMLLLDRFGCELLEDVRRPPDPSVLIADAIRGRVPAVPRVAAQTHVSGEGDPTALHLRNWLNSMRTRQPAVASWEVGNRATTACNLAVIAHKTKKLIRWDPVSERTTGDPSAEKLTTKRYRSPWSLPAV